MTTIFENWYDLGIELDEDAVDEISCNAASTHWDTNQIHGYIHSNDWYEPDEPAEYDVNGYDAYLDECASEVAYIIADGAEVTPELLKDVLDNIFDIASVVMSEKDWYEYSVERWDMENEWWR